MFDRDQNLRENSFTRNY